MVDTLLQKMKTGDRRALARLMTLVENEHPEVPRIFAGLYRDLGRAHRLGVTGPPGAGKSTLVGRLIESFCDAKETVGVVAVDPSSPITGGAFLGDRLRMPAAVEPGVFVRSMASRGHTGGLARQTLDVADLLDAFGHDWIIIETVGTGQGELEIVNEADTTLVVVHPGTGDSVQALKSGLFEVGDLFAVNKADQAGAEGLKAELEWAFHLRTQGTPPPVVLTSAARNLGVSELVDVIRRRRMQLDADGTLIVDRRKRIFRRLQRHVEMLFLGYLDRDTVWAKLLENFADRIMDQDMDRYGAYDQLARHFERCLGDPEGVVEA